MADFDTLSAAEQTARLTNLAQSALPLWGLAASELHLIKFRENAVFRVSAPGGEKYALRIHRHAYHSDEALRSELQWIAALDAGGIRVPSIIPTNDGRLFAHAQSNDVPGERQIDLFEWVEGKQLGAVEVGLDPGQSIAHVYGTIGELAARLHTQALAWQPPDGFRRHAWDADALAGDNPLWGRFWDLAALTPSQRSLLLEAKDRVYRGLKEYQADPENSNRYSMIHADFVAENLLVNGSDVRLIDFDDAGFGWHLFELATALYFERGEPHFNEAYRALIAGYRSECHLPDTQLVHMPLFFAARSFTYLGWVHTRPETETARNLTPALIEMSCEAVNDYFSASQ
ncbi:phosphotransferase enzyme family protein [Parahaliea mediterranea]|uniref:phosphotransferase enzyme family protein n=1 Tax=Parahaliea mediterranea TaxID=651086 RepID=UPI000E2EC627|nr:phosphotransferase [Parahaliea mediterranea]